MGTYILGIYGVHEWFADIDNGRKYWEHSDGIIAHILDFLTHEGFGSFMKEIGNSWVDVQEYRQRHLIKAINSKSLF